MTLFVKLYATLQQNRQDSYEMDLKPGSTVRDILRELDISEDDVGVVMINSRSGTFDQGLGPDDRVTLIPPIDGG
jgi:sulfur carrier protein ThiS